MKTSYSDCSGNTRATPKGLPMALLGMKRRDTRTAGPPRTTVNVFELPTRSDSTRIDAPTPCYVAGGESILVDVAPRWGRKRRRRTNEQERKIRERE